MSSCCGSSRRVVFVHRDDRGAPVSELGPAGADGLHERARGRRAVRARRDRAAERRPQVGQHLDAADADVLRFHSQRERDRADSDVRRRRADRSLRAPYRARLVPQERGPRRHDGDGELQRDRGAGDDHVRRDHRGRHEGARVRQALEEPRAARARVADLHPADSRSRSWACSCGRSR